MRFSLYQNNKIYSAAISEDTSGLGSGLEGSSTPTTTDNPKQVRGAPPIMAEYLKSLGSIRERTQLVLQQPQHLQHFDVHLDQMDAVVNAVMMLIVRDYSSPTDIPPHSRWRHFEAASAAMKLAKCDRINPLLGSWKKEMSKKGRSDTTTTTTTAADEREPVRRLVDLFVVSVLLDAGAGSRWSFHPQSEQTGESEKDKAASSYNRSEGLALASLEWFMAGGLSSDTDAHPLRADATGLAAVTHESLSAAFQVNQHSNPLVGVEGRCLLLNRLGNVCAKHTEYFGSTPASNRPGNLVDYLLDHSSTLHSDDGQSHTVDISLLWHVAMDAFAGVWPPSRTSLDGVFLGDVWPCRALAAILAARSSESSTESTTESTTVSEADVLGLVPFHKLSQWLTYSLMEPLSLLGVSFAGADLLTGLAEYRNGGLFVDMGVISLRDSSIHMRSQGPESVPRFNVFDDAVVEWRALTVGLLDMVADCVRERLSLSKDQLPLAKVLEAGTWKAGREIAASLRPITRGPPIDIISDGTVF
ncbi:hypothetical protein BASA50_003293 [Batrachochytrium salamandrivorans]|uniref:Uracil catabolism protein 4 n=1 Tax=Batrachochytrium salamandrivorans TaxID=1357716 RepID=A0ABQ8FLX3_9FUNG|nr:hypothetical protein BASA50_003293 [Batrachochytrium salamandrivorans]